MPLYTYNCTCGYDHEQFLTQNKAAILLKCLRCARKITAHQVRDKSISFVNKDYITGVTKHEKH